MKALIALTILALCAADASAGHCRNLYVQQVVAVPVYQQAVYYEVGQSIRTEAVIAKAIEKAAPAIAAEAVKQYQAIQAPQNGGGLALKAPPAILAQCAKCHHKGNDNTATYFDGTPITHQTAYRFVEVFVMNKNVPDEMKAIVARTPKESLGALQDAIMALPIVDAPVAQPQRQELPPEPQYEPAPQQPDRPPLTNGDRRYNRTTGKWSEWRDGQWIESEEHPPVDLPPPVLPAPPAEGGDGGLK